MLRTADELSRSVTDSLDSEAFKMPWQASSTVHDSCSTFETTMTQAVDREDWNF
jgi:hypothetical protein